MEIIKYINKEGLERFLNKLKTLFVQKEQGKGLSTNDFTDELENKLINMKSNVQSDWNINDNTNDAFIKNKPINLSDFNNDLNFINNTINNLQNYYNKTESYNKEEINKIIGNISSLKITIVQVLPTENISTNTIYLVPKGDTIEDIYKEYININGKWEIIGTTEIDLTNYYTKNEADNLLNNKANKSQIPTNISQLTNDSGYLTSLTGVTGFKGNSESTYRKGNVNITSADIGLGNVGNYKAVSTIANQGLNDTEKLNARTNIGSGTSNFDGNYNNLINKPTLGTSSTKDISISGNASITQVVMGNDTRLSDSRPASDVSEWAKSNIKPVYTKAEIGLSNVDNVKQYSASNLQPSVAKLTTARKINGISFDGTSDISIPVPTKTSQLTNDSNFINNNVLLEKLNNFYSFTSEGSKKIPVNSDLLSNTYKIIGNYYCSLTVDAATMINCPTKVAFVLKVDYSTGTGYPRQTFIDIDNNMYRRTFLDHLNTWSTVVVKNISTKDLKNDVTITTDGYALDARVGKTLNDKIVTVDNKVAKLENYSPMLSIYGDNQSKFFLDLGFTLNNSITELCDMLPIRLKVFIINNSNISNFNKSLPVSSGGIITISKDVYRGYIEFIDFRTNKKYIKSNIDKVWSNWELIVTDNNYVHTDNNFTSYYKKLLDESITSIEPPEYDFIKLMTIDVAYQYSNIPITFQFTGRSSTNEGSTYVSIKFTNVRDINTVSCEQFVVYGDTSYADSDGIKLYKVAESGHIFELWVKQRQRYDQMIVYNLNYDKLKIITINKQFSPTLPTGYYIEYKPNFISHNQSILNSKLILSSYVPKTSVNEVKKKMSTITIFSDLTANVGSTIPKNVVLATIESGFTPLFSVYRIPCCLRKSSTGELSFCYVNITKEGQILIDAGSNISTGFNEVDINYTYIS